MIGVYTGSRGELNFEDDLVESLQKVGWSTDVLNHLTVKQKDKFDPDNITSLEGNFRSILNDRNRKELNNTPLSDSEFDQVMAAINMANTPIKANILITGKSLVVTRDADSPDIDHRGKTVYLSVFEPAAIASGKTTYQIARQTVYETGSYKNDRRGDVTLLINGLPVIHIELKALKVDVYEAVNQIQKYKQEGVFTGLMGLVQVYFAMNPEDAVYFANYGDYNKRNDVFVFHWADENNNIIKDWRILCGKCGPEHAMLSIPEAHQIVSYYVVADRLKEVLKVMRSYQYYAVKAIVARTKRQKWGEHDPLGGINWCTTGGGKTMSSFKAGQMIRDLSLADKVVFVVDRTELNSQSLEDYNSFSRQIDDNDIKKGEVQDTETSHQLFAKLKSDDSKDALIITSIQKMNRINDDALKEKTADLEKIRKKRVVFIIDEAQRSQFGAMHTRVKETFPTALYFGFTGTPIMGEEEDDVHDSRSIFGKYISIYTIAAGIRDKNVLGFDPKAVPTYKDIDLKKAIGLQESRATEDEVDPKSSEFNAEKYKIYQHYIRDVEMKSEYKDKKTGKTVKGIEGLLPSKQYDNDKHRNAVVDYILENWSVLSNEGNGIKFHALLSTSSISEIIEYYHIFKSRNCGLNVTALFDPNLMDNTNPGATIIKEAAIEEIVKDYNEKYKRKTSMVTSSNDNKVISFKKDVMARLAHKKPYENIGNDKDKIIDILIIDDQLLTGYDSQYINTLYLDRVLETHRLIQAISRTNRVLDHDQKPFGIFRFFRKVYTMQDNLEEALRLYCEGDSVGVVVANTEDNIKELNALYTEIKKIFDKDKIQNFVKLPKDTADRQEFKKLFGKLKARLNAIRLQGGLKISTLANGDLSWDSSSENGQKILFDSNTYNVMLMRYHDMVDRAPTGPVSPSGQGFNISTNTSEIEMSKIDADYLEKHFRLTVPILVDVEKTEDDKDEAIKDMEAQFGKLSAIQQRYGHKVLDDIKTGKLKVSKTKKFIEYIYEYMSKARTQAIQEVADKYGLCAAKLTEIIDSKPNEVNLNDGTRFTALINGCDMELVKKLHPDKSALKARMLVWEVVKQFILVDINNI